MKAESLLNDHVATATATANVGDDQLRAGTWSLLGRLLAAAPDGALLDQLRLIDDRNTDRVDGMTKAWSALRKAADEADPAALAIEYQDLFIGVGSSEIVPYASYFVAGALMERPLVDLRQDLQMLGVERQDHVSEPEDHAGAICEVMAMVISDPDISEDWQPTFFHRHIEGWMGRFFRELQQAPSASFYRAVGGVGEEFLGLEGRYFSMSA